MHRNFSVYGDGEVLRRVAHELLPLAEVISIRLDDAGAMKPKGGVLELQVLNVVADEVLRRLQPAVLDGRVAILVASSNVILDRDRQKQIDEDADEMLWEEMEQNLRNTGRTSPNSLVLMALGGAISAASVAAAPLLQLTGFIAGSIVAPAFEPVVSISFGLVLRQWHVARRALLATLAGYAALIGGAALAWLLLQPLGQDGVRTLAHPGVQQVLSQQPAGLLISVGCAVAGGLMVVSLRDIYVVGPLIGLVVVPAAASIGCAVVLRDWHTFWIAAARVAVDLAMVLVAGALVFWVKQRMFHQRRPID
jgi:hypothetical protein